MRQATLSCLALALLALGAAGGEPAAVDWGRLPRKLAAAPRLASEKPQYVLFAIGPSASKVAAVVFDESQGTGKGYDTAYADLNLDGNLADAGNRLSRGKDGEFRMAFAPVWEADGSLWKVAAELRLKDYRCQVFVSVEPPGKPVARFELGLLPAVHALATGDSLETAPVYHPGGPLRLGMPDKLKPVPFGAIVRFDLPLYVEGTAGARLCFYNSRIENKLPSAVLRVLRNGKAIDEVPFVPGCL